MIPRFVDDCNYHMGDVDTTDQYRSPYSYDTQLIGFLSYLVSTIWRTACAFKPGFDSASTLRCLAKDGDVGTPGMSLLCHFSYRPDRN